MSKKKSNSILTVVGVIVFLVLAGFFALTGSDPLGLFNETEVVPVGDAPQVVGSGGDWWQLYFTDPANVDDPTDLSGTVPAQLIDLINNAEDTIHIASFEFNLTPVAEALIAAHQNGVEVLWVTDDEHGLEADQFEDDHGQFALLQEAGIEVRDDGRSALMHNKFWIFDNRIVWTGSTNITSNGTFRNNNNAIVIESTRLAAIYEREFAEMWAGEFGPRSPSTINDQSLTIQGSTVQALFAAEDEVIDELIPLVESAQESVYFMAFSFTHDRLGEAVLNVPEGVDVAGIFETRASETEFSELPSLYCAGFDVRQDGNPGTFHHKVFIIDGEIVVTGSLNFSDNANDSNDENVLIIHNRDIADQYLQEFDRRWAEAEEPDPADMACN